MRRAAHLEVGRLPGFVQFLFPGSFFPSLVLLHFLFHILWVAANPKPAVQNREGRGGAFCGCLVSGARSSCMMSHPGARTLDNWRILYSGSCCIASRSRLRQRILGMNQHIVLCSLFWFIPKQWSCSTEELKLNTRKFPCCT